MFSWDRCPRRRSTAPSTASRTATRSRISAATLSSARILSHLEQHFVVDGFGLDGRSLVGNRDSSTQAQGLASGIVEDVDATGNIGTIDWLTFKWSRRAPTACAIMSVWRRGSFATLCRSE